MTTVLVCVFLYLCLSSLMTGIYVTRCAALGKPLTQGEVILFILLVPIAWILHTFDRWVRR